MNLPEFLAWPAFAGAVAALSANLYYFWYNRAGLRWSHRAFFAGEIAGWSLFVVGYALVLAGVVTEPPVNSTFLRLGVVLVSGLSVMHPAMLLDNQQQYGLSDDIKERISRANHYRNEALDCQERLKTVEQTNIFLLDLNDRRRREEVELKAQIVELKTQIMQSRMGGDSS